MLADLLQSVPDIGGRIVVDKTGLPGNYDLSLQWTPMDTAAPSSAGNSLPSNAENPALFTAIEDQLGLKLVFMRAPGQVLIIDHIERPSEN